MKSLIIYDDAGTIFSSVSGEYLLPQGGIQFMEVEVPEGKQIVSVDVSVTPHKPILEDVPPTEVEQLRVEMAEANAELFEMMLMISGGSI